ncbi:hypothetical protein A3463_01495 [Enterobacter chengduensis]|nr:hypothetical protein A3463_01495 [Enterobacter chengduensis]
MATELQRRKITSRTTDMTPGMKNTGENQAEARYRQVTHGALTSAKSGRKGRRFDKTEGAEGQRRRRVPLPPFPAGEQTFRVVHACDCTLRDGKRGYR